MPKYFKVVATKDHYVGRELEQELAVPKGAIREVEISAGNHFSTTTEKGSFFGWCQLGHGWELMPRRLTQKSTRTTEAMYVTIKVRFTQPIPIAKAEEFVQEMDYGIKSKTQGVTIQDTEVVESQKLMA
jgi:hypothetical protein